MFQFRTLLLMTTLCLSLSSNALPVGPPRQVDAVHHEAARNLVSGVEPRGSSLTHTTPKSPGVPVAHSVTSPQSSAVKSVAVPSSVATASLATSHPVASSTLPTSAAGSAIGTNASCTLSPTPAAKASSLVVSARDAAIHLSKRALVTLNRLMGRDPPEFVGFHGTNSATAAFWASQGGIISRPPSSTGILDFLGITSTSSRGTSGADAELGPGLYVADEPVIAHGFANNNAAVNRGTAPVVCAIFAVSSGNWRNVIPKAFIPQSLVGDSSNPTRAQQKESNRLRYIKNRGVTASTSAAAAAVKFSLLDTRARTGQMVIPSVISTQFFARCFPAGLDPSRQFPPGSLPPLNAFRYDAPAIRSAWSIRSESQSTANAILGC